MNNHNINLSIMASCSYTWNRNRFHGKSTAMNVVMCVKTVICALFCARTVQLSKAEEIYNHKNNHNTIFGKEYKKYKDRISHWKVEKQHNVTDDNNQSTLKVQYISSVELNELMNNQATLDDIHYILKDDLVLDNRHVLPKHLTIEGSFIATLTNFTHFPEDLKVLGDIFLAGCTKLTTLPKSFCKVKSIDLADCTALTSVPETMESASNINFSRCSSLKNPPKKMSAADNIFFIGCSNLENLPETLYANYSVLCTGCPKIKIIPSNTVIKGCLVLSTHLIIPEEASIAKIEIRGGG